MTYFKDIFPHLSYWFDSRDDLPEHSFFVKDGLELHDGKELIFLVRDGLLKYDHVSLYLDPNSQRVKPDDNLYYKVLVSFANISSDDAVQSFEGFGRFLAREKFLRSMGYIPDKSFTNCIGPHLSFSGRIDGSETISKLIVDLSSDEITNPPVEQVVSFINELKHSREEVRR